MFKVCFLLNRFLTILTLIACCLIILLKDVRANSLICQTLNAELLRINGSLKLSAKQAKHYDALHDALIRAQRDSKRFRCTGTAFRAAKTSKECEYITSSINRIETSINQMQGSNSKRSQSESKQKIQSQLQRNRCHMPANNRMPVQLIKPPAKTVKAVKQRLPVIQKNRSSSDQNRPANDDNSLLNENNQEHLPAVQPVSLNKHHIGMLGIASKNGLNKLKSQRTVNKLSLPHTDPVEFIADPKIRLVGPKYFPAQQAAEDQLAPAQN